MNNKNQKPAILKVFSIVTILLLFFAGGPIWIASAQDSPTDSPTETPGEVPVETPTPSEIITPQIPFQETEVPTQEAIKTTAPTDQINIAPSIRTWIQVSSATVVF